MQVQSHHRALRTSKVLQHTPITAAQLEDTMRPGADLVIELQVARGATMHQLVQRGRIAVLCHQSMPITAATAPTSVTAATAHGQTGRVGTTSMCT